MKLISLIGIINLVCSNYSFLSSNTKKVTHVFDNKLTYLIKNGDVIYGNLDFGTSNQNTLYRIITTGDADTYLELYEGNNLIKANDDDGGSKNSVIYSRLDPTKEYYYKLKVKDSSYKNVTVDFDPEYPIYFNSFEGIFEDYDYIDTISEVNNTIEYLNTTGYYVYNTTNEKLSSLNVNGTNDRYKLNNKYYFISSHGKRVGDIIYNTTETCTYDFYKDISNCDVAIFAICHGGRANNAAEGVVKYKNCKNSLGWPGSTYTNTSPVFTKELFKRFSYGDNIYEAARSALKKIDLTFWFGNGIHENDTIRDYKIFGLTENELNLNSVNLICDENKYVYKVEKIDLSLFNKIVINNQKYYVLNCKNIYTNYFIKEINGELFSNLKDFSLDCLDNSQENKFYLKDEDQYLNIKEIINGLEINYIDAKTNEVLDIDKFADLIGLE